MYYALGEFVEDSWMVLDGGGIGGVCRVRRRWSSFAAQTCVTPFSPEHLVYLIRSQASSPPPPVPHLHLDLDLDLVRCAELLSEEGGSAQLEGGSGGGGGEWSEMLDATCSAGTPGSSQLGSAPT